MQTLSVDLESCYGIKTLHYGFDFSSQNVYAIYAPNGAMKSSLAQTFADVADGEESGDRVFPTRDCSRQIQDEDGHELPPESILVVSPLDEYFSHTERISTLLVDARLREEYERLSTDVEKAKSTLLKALKAESGSKKDIEAEVSATFTKAENQFQRALTRVKDELLAQTDAPFAGIEYDIIFDEKALAFLATEDFKSAIAEYVTKYNELLDASTYFRRGTFNYYNASTIAKSLADNGFFEAKHSVRLNATTTMEINSQAQLEELIAKEKEGITSDPALRKKFARIEKLITKNANLRQFQSYLGEREELLPELVNLGELREKLWKSYLRGCLDPYESLMEIYLSTAKRKSEIQDEAARQRTQWETVIDIFNSRFFVPFTLLPKNRLEVMLGAEPMLMLGFEFCDGDDTAEVHKDDLMKVLSSGEKRAFYILNVIFEIEARKKAEQETLFVIDDVADSFDYKNKYAIIQYLKDIADEGKFKQIILTHNFDFFRTLNSRFVHYDHCLMATRTAKGLELDQAEGIQNVFVNDWKKKLFTDCRKRVASIPFVRNLIEYTRGDEDARYLQLTSLLHWREDSASVSQGNLDAIFNSLFEEQGTWPDSGRCVIDDVLNEADACLAAGESSNLAHKIVLSIAIRLVAERFMTESVGAEASAACASQKRTGALFDRFRECAVASSQAVETIERVMLMTPENIHLNSFMYEPILDMSDEHLKKLYSDVKALQ
jgi:hypothetical protein